MGAEMKGDWDRMDRRFHALGEKVRVGIARAEPVVGAAMVAGIVAEMHAVSPALHPFSAERKGSDEPLVGGEMEQAVTFRVTPGGGGVWAGIPAGPLARIARVQEEGATIEVTPAMRAHLHAEGLHLRADTTHVVIPARPFVAPGIAKARRPTRELLKAAVKGALRDR